MTNGKVAVKTNFNLGVKVRLTERGIEIMKKRHYDLQVKVFPVVGEIEPFKEKKTDENGYTEFQIWGLMETFGGQIGWGSVAPFEGDMIFMECEEIK